MSYNSGTSDFMVFGLFGKKGSKKPSKAKHSPKKASKPKPSKVKKVAKHVVKTAPKSMQPAPKMQPIQERMDELKAYEMLKSAKFPVAPYFVVKSEKDLPEAMKKVGTPFVMKITGTKFAHRSEVGGLVKDVKDNAADVWKQLAKIKGAEKVFAQKQLSGVELIVSAKAEPQFGYIVSIGLGGIYKDILRDVAFRVVPLDLVQAQAMVKELKGFEVLAGAQIKLEALYELLVKLGRYAADNKLKEIVFNPVFCSPEGCWIVSAKILK